MTASTRYFYKARHALHQMLEHGFNFPGYSEQDIRRLIGQGDENALLETDSLHLLKPRKDDMLDQEYTDESHCMLMHDGQEYNEIYLAKNSGWKIIQRNGVAFIWPETNP